MASRHKLCHKKYRRRIKRFDCNFHKSIPSSTITSLFYSSFLEKPNDYFTSKPQHAVCNIYDPFTGFLSQFLFDISYGTRGVRTWHSRGAIRRATPLTTRPWGTAHKSRAKVSRFREPNTELRNRSYASDHPDKRYCISCVLKDPEGNQTIQMRYVLCAMTIEDSVSINIIASVLILPMGRGIFLLNNLLISVLIFASVKRDPKGKREIIFLRASHVEIM